MDGTKLYGQEDFASNQRQLRREWVRLAILSLPLLLLLIFSLVRRMEMATILVTIVWGALAIFLGSLKLGPVYAYRRYLREVTSGLSRETQGVVVSYAEDLTFKEGVQFHVLTVNVGQTGDEEDDRIFYFDHYKPQPGLTPGERVNVTSHSNFVIGLSRA
ncbi:hypothetical protein [Beduinella massiliensis]|uniref:hypothetical protein n=1 Tax=Beduinella massiliensis TaxID=1852363 RepID=UPI000C81781E